MWPEKPVHWAALWFGLLAVAGLYACLALGTQHNNWLPMAMVGVAVFTALTTASTYLVIQWFVQWFRK